MVDIAPPPLPGKGNIVVYCLWSTRARHGERHCDRSYIGYTTNLTQRVRKHNGEIKGGAKATRGYVWQCVWYVSGFTDKQDAMRLEWLLHHTRKMPPQKNKPFSSALHRRLYHLWSATQRPRFTRRAALNRTRKLHIHVQHAECWRELGGDAYTWPQRWCQVVSSEASAPIREKNSLSQQQTEFIQLPFASSVTHVDTVMTTNAIAPLDDVLVNFGVLCRLRSGEKIKTKSGRFIEIDNDYGQCIWRRMANEGKKDACYFIEILTTRAIELSQDPNISLKDKMDLTQAMERGITGIITLQKTTYVDYPTVAEDLGRRIKKLEHQIEKNKADFPRERRIIIPTVPESYTPTPSSENTFKNITHVVNTKDLSMVRAKLGLTQNDKESSSKSSSTSEEDEKALSHSSDDDEEKKKRNNDHSDDDDDGLAALGGIY